MLKPLRVSMAYALLMVVLLPLMAGCTTVTAGRVVQTQCPVIPAPPASLQAAPPAANFQENLRNFFYPNPTEPTLPPPTPNHATPG